MIDVSFYYEIERETEDDFQVIPVTVRGGYAPAMDAPKDRYGRPEHPDDPVEAEIYSITAEDGAQVETTAEEDDLIISYLIEAGECELENLATDCAGREIEDRYYDERY